MIIRRLNDMRRHEEGQALVLASISMLILCLCVLATINITYAARERIRLQNSTDAAAYTCAAYQARVLNLFAYTNRAMAVHYAGQMNLMAMVSYLSFCLAVFNLLSLIPYIGVVFKVLATIVKVLTKIIDIAVMLAVPAIDGLNFLTSIVQAAVNTSMLTRIIPQMEGEVKRTNPDYKVNQAFSTVFGLVAMKRWYDAFTVDFFPRFGAPQKDAEALNRAIMIEIANSGRHDWTAYGGKNGTGWTLLGGIPRRAAIKFGLDLGFFGVEFKLGKIARTEWGGFDQGSGGLGGIIGSLTGNLFKITEQLYSIDRFLFQVTFKVLGFKFGGKFTVDNIVRADRRGGAHTAPTPNFEVSPKCPRLIRSTCDKAVKALMAAPMAALGAILNSQAVNHGSFPPHFHFGMMNFARFNPKASGPEMFRQPPVLLLVTLPKESLKRHGAVFTGRFGAKLGTLTTAQSHLDDLANRDQYIRTHPPKRGFQPYVDFAPGEGKALPFLDEGFHAVAAAATYYHRPGDWREPPNLFNPFWGAKLLPVKDYPTIAGNRLLRTLLQLVPVLH